MFNLITIGDCTVDTFVVIDHDEASLQCDIKKDSCLLCLNYADKIPIRETHQSIGGNASNVAIGCQKLGMKTAIVTEVGDDLNGLAVKNELEEKKVDTSLLKNIKNGETRYGIVLNFQGERTVLSSYVKRNYTFPQMPQTDWIYYTSLGQSFEKIQKEIINYLKKNPQIKLAVNPGSYQIKYNIKKLKEILPYTDILFVNKEEAKKLTEETGKIKNLVKALHKKGVKKVVITDGTRGAYASEGNDIWCMPILPVPIVGKTGAGDAFASGFLSALYLKKDITECLRWGAANSSGVVQKIGAHEGLMNKKQIEQTLKKFSQTKPTKI